MGFHNRYIGDSSLLASARGNGFESFKTYMLKADSYMLEGEITTCFWNLFHDERESREDVWKILRNEGEDHEQLIQAVCKGWNMTNNQNNHPDQLEAINNYLDLIGSLGKNEEMKKSLENISKILKDRIKDKK
jgi:hypothetical protein